MVMDRPFLRKQRQKQIVQQLPQVKNIVMRSIMSASGQKHFNEIYYICIKSKCPAFRTILDKEILFFLSFGQQGTSPLNKLTQFELCIDISVSNKTKVPRNQKYNYCNL